MFDLVNPVTPGRRVGLRCGITRACTVDNPPRRQRHRIFAIRIRPGRQVVGVAQAGRVFDVIVLGKPGRDPKGPRMTTLEAGLFESGRPVLIAPPLPQPQMGTNF